MFSFFSIYESFEKTKFRTKKQHSIPFTSGLPSNGSNLFGAYLDKRIVKADDVRGYERYTLLMELMDGQNLIVNVDFLHLTTNEWTEKRIVQVVRWVQRIVFFVLKWARLPNERAPRELNIVLANSPVKKMLPDDGVFEFIHVNSGVNTRYLNDGSGYSFIYREEELVKVIVHELAHQMQLEFHHWDFPQQEQQLIANFPEWCKPMGSKVALSECFTDLIACWFMAHLLVLFGSSKWRYTKDEEGYLQKVRGVLEMQHEYLCRQAVKIIRVYKVEHTHVFAYFIAKAAIFDRADEVLNGQWHPSHGAKRNWQKFYAFVTRRLKSRTFAHIIRKVGSCKAVHEDKSLRMQRIEL